MLAVLAWSVSPVAADVIYHCVDERGHRSFSNIPPIPSKNLKCTSMNMGGASAPAPSPKAAPKPAALPATPAGFPKVEENVQKARDNDRRRILENELEAERNNLAQAKKALAEQAAVRPGDERNTPRGPERLQTYKDKVDLHERNIEAIQKEIGNLR